MQGEVVRSEQEVRIAERRAAAMAESAKGEAAATRLRAEAEADATRAVGAAKAEPCQLGVAALGKGEYTPSS
jgi:regulator of protease activity HflC (stomatin/prohibitin superfamily)